MVKISREKAEWLMRVYPHRFFVSRDPIVVALKSSVAKVSENDCLLRQIDDDTFEIRPLYHQQEDEPN